MKVSVQVDGLRDLDFALSQLPKSIQKSTLLRTLKKAAEPIADRARQLAPVRPGSGQLRKSIAVSTKIKNDVGKSEFHAALKAGLGVGAARTALRNARRSDPNRSFAVLYVGPSVEAPHAHFVEFGTSKMSPKPFMRPAWEAEKDNALAIIRRELGNEIILSARRLAKSKRRSASEKYSASLAALLAHEVIG